MSLSREEITVTVYFSPTGTPLSQNFAGALYNANEEKSDKQIKMGFNGPGSLRDWLFGSGYKKQCHEVKKRILTLIQQGKKVKLNCFGYSRGGAAALLLAKILGDFDKDILEINLALLDPVPGNSILAQKLDFLHLTWAKQIMDLSDCHNLNQVLALYTNQPLANSFLNPFFAPIFPKYPKKTIITEKALKGGHFSISDYFITQIKNFLKACGTLFNQRDQNNIDQEVEKEDKDSIIFSKHEYERTGHSYRSAIIKTKLNLSHLNNLAQETKANHTISIEPPISPRITSTQSTSMPIATVIFKDFLAELSKSMSEKSKISTKNESFQKINNEAKNIQTFINESDLKNALRNVLAWALQRDRYSYSLFSTTTTGYAAKSLLQQQKYQFLTNLIQGSAADEQLRYRDLRKFVLGENSESYFNARNRKRMYTILQSSTLVTDNLSIYRKKITSM